MTSNSFWSFILVAGQPSTAIQHPGTPATKGVMPSPTKSYWVLPKNGYSLHYITSHIYYSCLHLSLFSSTLIKTSILVENSLTWEQCLLFFLQHEEVRRQRPCWRVALLMTFCEWLLWRALQRINNNMCFIPDASTWFLPILHIFQGKKIGLTHWLYSGGFVENFYKNLSITNKYGIS